MSHPIIDELEKSQIKENLPEIFVGDKLKVAFLIREGKKERTQYFEGLVIGIKGAYSRKTLVMRKIVQGIGVEKTFLINSNLVSEIKVLKRGKVRRAKLFYLRKRLGSEATAVKTK